MKLTLLSVVQSYLNRVSDFYVDSINDTEVSLQVAQIAEEVYYQLIQRFRDWEFTTKVGTLDAISDVNRPNLLLIDSSVQRVDLARFEYNNTDGDNGVTVNYRPVTYLEPEAFSSLMSQRTSNLDNTTVVTDLDGSKYVVYTNRHPSYCTSYDGVHIVFDSYDSEEDSTLQASKSRVVYTEEPVFLQEDSFVIPIPEHLSELYRDMVIIECYENLLQQNAPPSTVRRATSRMAAAQQHERKTGSMNKGKKAYGR